MCVGGEALLQLLQEEEEEEREGREMELWWCGGGKEGGGGADSDLYHFLSQLLFSSGDLSQRLPKLLTFSFCLL